MELVRGVPSKDRAYYLVCVACIGLSAFAHLSPNTSPLRSLPVCDSGQLDIGLYWAVKRQNVFTVFNGMCLGFSFSRRQFPDVETPSSLGIFKPCSTVGCVKRAGCVQERRISSRGCIFFCPLLIWCRCGARDR